MKRQKKKIILPTLKYENAPSDELQIRVGLDEEKSLLRIDDRDVILDLAEQFKVEREACLRYKIFGKIKVAPTKKTPKNLLTGVLYL